MTAPNTTIPLDAECTCGHAYGAHACGQAPCYLCALSYGGDRCEAFVLPIPPRERFRAALAIMLEACEQIDVTPYNIDLASFALDRGRVSAQFHEADDANALADFLDLPKEERLHPGGTLFSREGEQSWEVAGRVEVSITARTAAPVPA